MNESMVIFVGSWLLLKKLFLMLPFSLFAVHVKVPVVCFLRFIAIDCNTCTLYDMQTVKIYNKQKLAINNQVY